MGLLWGCYLAGNGWEWGSTSAHRETLLHVVLPVKSLTCNATVHKGMCRGWDWCTAATRPHADVLKQF